MRQIRIGMIGYKFMGKAHSQGFKDQPIFFPIGVDPVLKVICGRDKGAVREAASNYGWQDYETDWRKVVARGDVDLVDITTPNDMHREIAVAAAEAGKDILCEKPMARNLSEAKEMVRAVESAGVKHMIAFCNRRVPAITLAKQLIEEGKIGKIYHWRCSWLADWCVDPLQPFVWRNSRDVAGSGALGDIGSHMVDLSQYLVGEIVNVNGVMKTYISERPIEKGSQRMLSVGVDDAAAFIARFENDALGIFELSRCATGNKERYGFEINGSKGAVRFDYNHLNELQFFSSKDNSREQGFRCITLGGDVAHPYTNKWGWGGGHGESGYGDLFTYQAYELFQSILTDQMPQPNFLDGLRNQAVLEAVKVSAQENRWVEVDQLLRQI